MEKSRNLGCRIVQRIRGFLSKDLAELKEQKMN